MRLLQIIVLIALTFQALPAQKQSAETWLRKGDKAYAQDSLTAAFEAYEQAKNLSNKPIAPYNQGVTLQKQGKADQARTAYSEAIINGQGSPETSANAWFNLGNGAMERGAYADAVHAYKNSLKIKPNQPDAKQNLQLAKRKLQEQSKKNQEQQQEQASQQEQQNQEGQAQNPQQNQQPTTQDQKELDQMLNLLEQEEQKVRRNTQKKGSNKGNGAQKRW